MIDDILNSEKLVFSWGVSKPLFKVSELCKSLWIIEADYYNYYINLEKFRDIFRDNVIIKYVPSDKIIDDLYKINDKSYKNFVHSIEDYPTKCFDVIIFNNLINKKGIELALKAIRPGGVFLFNPTFNFEEFEVFFLKKEEVIITNTLFSAATIL